MWNCSHNSWATRPASRTMATDNGSDHEPPTVKDHVNLEAWAEAKQSTKGFVDDECDAVSDDNELLAHLFDLTACSDTQLGLRALSAYRTARGQLPSGPATQPVPAWGTGSSDSHVVGESAPNVCV
jgi:hypothetical protein